MDLPSPRQIKEAHPLQEEVLPFVTSSRDTVCKIFDRQDPRLLLIVGPCSIHRIEECLEYARALKQLADDVKDSCFLVMRAYIEKPRTRQGWKGFLHDPHLNGSDEIPEGLKLARFFLSELAAIGIPVATEFLTPHLIPYVEDLITWGCIGARTSSSQIHRILASSLSMPMGFKNTVDGNIDCAIDGVHVARSPHTFMQINDAGQLSVIRSKGNPYTHIVLRGSYKEANFQKEHVQRALTKLREEELPPRILIDCSHGNSRGQYFKQKEAFQSIMQQIADGNHQIMGMMLESHLEAGAQKIPAQLAELQRGVSITDACLDFSTAAELISSLSSSSFTSMSLTHN